MKKPSIISNSLRAPLALFGITHYWTDASCCPGNNELIKKQLFQLTLPPVDETRPSAVTSLIIKAFPQYFVPLNLKVNSLKKQVK